LVRGIGLWGLSASIVNSVVGVSIFTMPAAVALEAGAAAPAAYLVCAVIMAGVTTCFAEAGGRVPTSGGAYGTVEAAFGPATGFVVGMLLVVSDLLASGGIAAAIADLAGAQTPVLAQAPGRIGIIAGVYLLLSWANLVGVRTTARLIAGATLVKLVPLFLFLAIGAATLLRPGHAGPPLPPGTLGGFGRGLILTLFAFQGMETALGASGEVRDPSRTVPSALILAMLFVLALYLGVQLTAQHLLGASLAQAAAPLADAAATVSAPARDILLGGGALSMLAWMASDVLGTSRMLFAMARDRRLPAWLGRLNQARRVPGRAVVVYVLAASVLAATGSFLELVALSSLATVAVYIMGCAAALKLRRRDIALAGPPPRVPALGLAAVVGIGGMFVMIAAARWQEIAGLGAVILGSLAIVRVSENARV
jgi:amino acid transporter